MGLLSGVLCIAQSGGILRLMPLAGTVGACETLKLLQFDEGSWYPNDMGWNLYTHKINHI